MHFSRTLRPCLIVGVTVSLFSSAFAQWKDTKFLFDGGESTVASDNQGNVYVTMHEPCVLMASRDWGGSFIVKQQYPEGFCDLDVIALPNGNVNVAFLLSGATGLASYFSTDQGHTFQKGTAPKGPLDREWLAANLANGDVYMDYSNGYIEGPKSKGVFLATSTDHGKTFKETGRIDGEPDGDYAVDPYLTTSSDGRIYAMWSTSRDYNNIDRFDFSYSKDGGKTFEGHQTIGTVNKDLGDAQERWILGCFTAFGEKEIVAVYPNYQTINVDGTDYNPLLLYYRVSTDGGATFGDSHLVSSMDEIKSNIRTFVANKKADDNVGYYVQTLPWTCADPYGRFYIVYQDNRGGQSQIADDYFDKWQVRFAEMDDLTGFGPSEQVSNEIACLRPPLDFMSCTADSKFAYVTWTETPGYTGSRQFTGHTYLGRKILHKPGK